jgi:hypothetical protein
MRNQWEKAFDSVFLALKCRKVQTAEQGKTLFTKKKKSYMFYELFEVRFSRYSGWSSHHV